jgi:hypothetical protein
MINGIAENCSHNEPTTVRFVASAIDTKKSAISLRDLEKFKMTTKGHRGCDSGNNLSLDDLHAHTVPLNRF